MTPSFSASEVVWNGEVSVLAERCMRARHHPETQPAVARGRKSKSMRISALAQTDQMHAMVSSLLEILTSYSNK